MPFRSKRAAPRRRPRRRVKKRPSYNSFVRKVLDRAPTPKIFGRQGQFNIQPVPGGTFTYVDSGYLKIPIYDPSPTLTQEANIIETRTTDLCYVKGLHLKMSMIDNISNNTRIRVIVLYQNTVNEQLTVPSLNNLFQTADFVVDSPNAAYNNLFVQHVNKRLIRSRKDILYDRTFDMAPYNSNPAVSTPLGAAGNYTRTQVRINKYLKLNKLINFESGNGASVPKQGNLHLIVCLSQAGDGVLTGDLFGQWETRLHFAEQ